MLSRLVIVLDGTTGFRMWKSRAAALELIDQAPERYEVASSFLPSYGYAPLDSRWARVSA